MGCFWEVSWMVVGRPIGYLSGDQFGSCRKTSWVVVGDQLRGCGEIS